LTLKINFVDFWSYFDKKDNPFFKILSQYYEVKIDNDPDILFYSCYGWDYLQYKCPRIYYTAENKAVDFTAADFGISFRFSKNRKHYRFPFYAYVIYQDNLLPVLTRKLSYNHAREMWDRKDKFCCMVISNSKASKRNSFFEKLSLQRKVDSGGGYLNNIGFSIRDKINFIADYKFVLSFENESFRGYVTEKLIHSLQVNSIPIYWGDPSINEEFNSKRFLNLADFESEEDLINKILNILSDEQEAIKILTEPVFKNEELPKALNFKNFELFLLNAVRESLKIKPVAITYKRHLHKLKILTVKFKKKVFFLKKKLRINGS
tara:strand:- start:12152 stop:13111 length:960 start_codon:yes stop_codon:yes gene_type:complete